MLSRTVLSHGKVGVVDGDLIREVSTESQKRCTVVVDDDDDDYYY